MRLGPNTFKRRLADPSAPVASGLFLALGDPVAAEICAGSDYDLLIIDGEHGPNGLRGILGQLQATSAYPVETAVRVASSDPIAIQQVLDLGARTVLVPQVDTAEQAEQVVAATRYQGGTRGVSMARAARWGRVRDYHSHADREMCVIVQLESERALENLEAICAVDGIDAAFVGAMDLATSMGLPGGGDLPEILDLVEATIKRISAAGIAAGAMASSEAFVARSVAAGADLITVGVDARLLAEAVSARRLLVPGVTPLGDLPRRPHTLTADDSV